MSIALPDSTGSLPASPIVPSPEVDLNIADVVAITQEVFSCDPTFETMRDPEDARCEFIVVTVQSHGQLSEFVRKRLEWHSRIKRVLPGHFSDLRLSIIPLPCNQASS